MPEPIEYYTNSPLLEGLNIGDEVDVTIRVKVTRVLPAADVGGLMVKGKSVTMTLPTRIIRKVEKVIHA